MLPRHVGDAVHDAVERLVPRLVVPSPSSHAVNRQAPLISNSGEAALPRVGRRGAPLCNVRHKVPDRLHSPNAAPLA